MADLFSNHLYFLCVLEDNQYQTINEVNNVYEINRNEMKNKYSLIVRSHFQVKYLKSYQYYRAQKVSSLPAHLSGSIKVSFWLHY